MDNMDKWKGLWKCPGCGSRYTTQESIGMAFTCDAVYADGDCGGELVPYNRRAPDPLLPLVREALKSAARLIDELGASPLELAAKYGPDYEPPTTERLVEMRDFVEATIPHVDAALASKEPDKPQEGKLSEGPETDGEEL